MNLDGINVWLFAAALQFVAAPVVACSWSDHSGDVRIESGLCTFSEISQSGTIDVVGRVATVTETVRVERGATLVIDGADFEELRLLSTLEKSAHLIAEAGTLLIRDTIIESYDPETGGPDTNMSDGRAFLRVDGYVDDSGQVANGRLEIDRSRLSHLGYDSRYVDTSEFSSYGVSLKVRSEEDLRTATISGHIRDSILSHNFRGFYSYGAQDFEIRDSKVHDNVDYGIDGHDDTDRLIVTGNRVFSNGGTGLICSRRCDGNVFENNDVYRNGANGIVLHDISTGGRILNNRVYDNVQDGVVIHDSQDTLVAGNEIRGNRHGLRVFSGSVLTTVTGNLFGANAAADIFIKHGNLDGESDLSDYSNGPDWNAQNIARHNSSRVWATEIVGNTFEAPVSVSARGADYLSFSQNSYASGVSFDIRSSSNIELDGAGSGGPVRYLLRGDPDTAAEYLIAAPVGAELSMTGSDRVTTSANDQLIPDGGDFMLRIEANGPNQLSLNVPDRKEIRTTVLVGIPIAPISGFAWISGYKNRFIRDRTILLNISTHPGESFRFRAFDRVCSVVEWSLGGLVFVAAGKEIVELSSVDHQELRLTCLGTAPG